MSFPDYDLRISARARRLQIKVNRQGRLQVVVPAQFDPEQVPFYLMKHRRWIQRAMQRVEDLRESQPQLFEQQPKAADLAAINQQWQIEYRDGQRAHWQVVRPGQLRVRGESPASLHDWLNRQAKQHLLPWFEQVSEEIGLAFNQARVRAQKTRWGSCSSKKNINLNRNLLFLPPEWVRYLFIHELCHTRHMNHSTAYWKLVQQFEPDFRRFEQQLTHAGSRVPAWAMPD